MGDTYFASEGRVYLRDGPWDVRLSEPQVEQLLSIFDTANAVYLFNELYAASVEAGHVPGVFSRKPALRVVAENPDQTPDGRSTHALRMVAHLGRDPGRNPEPPTHSAA